MREFGAFVKKEFYHILRDKRTMLIVLVMPVVLIILFGFALSTEVRNVNIAILSPSSDPTVRQIAERLDASEYFTVTQWLDRPEEIDEVMKSGEVQLVVAFGQNFSGGMLSPDGSQMQLIVDASDANMAQSYTSYASGIIAAFGNEMASGGTESGILTQVQFLYNPQMKSAYNFVPGIMGLIMMLICAMMTSISIVREKETGTMEVLLVCPCAPSTSWFRRWSPTSCSRASTWRPSCCSRSSCWGYLWRAALRRCGSCLSSTSSPTSRSVCSFRPWPSSRSSR